MSGDERISVPLPPSRYSSVTFCRKNERRSSGIRRSDSEWSGKSSGRGRGRCVVIGRSSRPLLILGCRDKRSQERPAENPGEAMSPGDRIDPRSGTEKDNLDTGSPSLGKENEAEQRDRQREDPQPDGNRGFERPEPRRPVDRPRQDDKRQKREDVEDRERPFEAQLPGKRHLLTPKRPQLVPRDVVDRYITMPGDVSRMRSFASRSGDGTAKGARDVGREPQTGDNRSSRQRLVNEPDLHEGLPRLWGNAVRDPPQAALPAVPRDRRDLLRRGTGLRPVPYPKTRLTATRQRSAVMQRRTWQRSNHAHECVRRGQTVGKGWPEATFLSSPAPLVAFHIQRSRCPPVPHRGFAS